MLFQSFFNAYTPYLQKRLVSFDDGLEHRIEKMDIVKQTYFLLFLFGIVGIFTVAGTWIIFNYLIDEKYLTAMEFMPLIIFANFIYSFYSFAVQYIYKTKKTFVMGIITFTGSLIQMIMSYYFIRIYGVMGAVYSLLIGNLFTTVGISLYSNFVYKMPWFLFRKEIKNQSVSRENIYTFL